MRNRRNRYNKKHAIVVIIAMCLLILGCAWYLLPRQQRQEIWQQVLVEAHIAKPPEEMPDGLELKVHFLDVGQGDSTLIESKGHFLLLDAGEIDQGEVVIDDLRELGVERLDYVIGTHPHSDHIGGMADAVEYFTPDYAIISPISYDSWSYRHLMMELTEQDVQQIEPEVGAEFPLGDARITILAPNGDYGENINDWSIGIRVVCGSTAFVFTGDAEEAGERDICGNGLQLKADVLKLGHHGSSSSTGWELLDAVSPSSVVISCGKENDYDYPHRKTMEKVQDLDIYRTDEQGSITAVSDGRTITWSAQPWNESG